MSKSNYIETCKQEIWERFEESGAVPTQREIHHALGRGSMRDVNKAFKEWYSELSDLVHDIRHRPEMPDPVWQSMRTLWEQSLENAREIEKTAWLKERREKEQDIETMRSQVKDLQNQILGMKAGAKEQQKVIEDLESTIRDQKEEQSSYKDKINELQLELGKAQERAEQQEKRALETIEDIREIRKETEAALKEKDRAQQQMQDLYQRQVDKADEEINMLKRQLEKNNALQQQLREKLATYKAQLESSTEQEKKLQSQIEKDKERHGQHVKRYQAEIEQQKNENAALRSKMEIMVQEIGTLKERIIDLTKKAENHEIAELKKMLVEVRKSNRE